MALAFYFAPSEFTPERYDATIKRLEAAGAAAPPGRKYHVAFEADGKIQVVRHVGVAEVVRGLRGHAGPDHDRAPAPTLVSPRSRPCTTHRGHLATASPPGRGGGDPRGLATPGMNIHLPSCPCVVAGDRGPPVTGGAKLSFWSHALARGPDAPGPSRGDRVFRAISGIGVATAGAPVASAGGHPAGGGPRPCSSRAARPAAPGRRDRAGVQHTGCDRRQHLLLRGAEPDRQRRHVPE